MDGREDLLMVSIETEQDWRRIQQNISTALLARLDRQLATEQSGDKGVLLPHIHQFLESLFEIARPKIRINGCITEVPCGDEDELERFDEALDRHIWSLSDQRLKWDKEIAGHRRTRPGEIERALLKSLAQHHMSDMDVAEDPSTYHELMPKQLGCELEQTLLGAISLAPQLAQSIASQHARTTKIKPVSAEVKALKS
ncbi:hypothetical protein PAXRUDRAFT_830657 [Paxillus rubicundulus Ve08.2h10]|uniref:Uncharacterized protein n=1 Tax=Paxillus rubicundulus Ve08.2h10 TaxID=930991 RepID=A0A0D0DYF4_9AGAM|nr:hypothetical protein PAXRUDRAFT_830657 [Paxillus rubicundulus Ve08.2h10]